MSSHCSDCIKGVRHEGEPTGKLEQIGGVECYVATPDGEYSKDKVVLFLTDAMGITFINNQLLADDFARNGFWTVMPNLLADDPVHESDLNNSNFDLMAWIGRHQLDSWAATLDQVVSALKGDLGVQRLGVTAYCFGGIQSFYLAHKNECVVTVASHPSLLTYPDDLEKYRDISRAPLLLNSCEIDQQFSPDKQVLADEILGGGKFAPGYERTYWDGCTHGFAVRGDMSNPKAKAGKEGAFDATAKFLKKYL